MRHYFFIIIVILLLAHPSLVAADPQLDWAGSPANVADEDGDPKVRVDRPQTYKAQEIIFFPLLIPQYAIMFVTSPIIFLGMKVEQMEIYKTTTDSASNPKRTFFIYPLLSGGQGSGFGGGIGITKKKIITDTDRIRATYKFFVSTDMEATVAYDYPKLFTIGGRPVDIEAFGYGKIYHTYKYYGEGNGTPRSNESEFEWIQFRGGIIFDYNLPWNLHIKPHLIVSTDYAGEPSGGSFPSVSTTFPLSQLPGFDRWVNYIDIGFSMSHDTLNDHDRPSTGGLQQIRLSRMQGFMNPGFDFNQMSLEVKQYFELWKKGRVLSLRGVIAATQPTSGGSVPFYRQASLGSPAPLRSYDRGRFHDNTYILFNAEYRYPVWDVVEAVALFDAGRVYDDLFTDFTFKRWKYSAGGGVRIMVPNYPVFSAMAATGAEGTRVFFSTKYSI